MTIVLAKSKVSFKSLSFPPVPGGDGTFSNGLHRFRGPASISSPGSGTSCGAAILETVCKEIALD